MLHPEAVRAQKFAIRRTPWIDWDAACGRPWSPENIMRVRGMYRKMTKAYCRRGCCRNPRCDNGELTLDERRFDISTREQLLEFDEGLLGPMDFD